MYKEKTAESNAVRSGIRTKWRSWAFEHGAQACTSLRGTEPTHGRMTLGASAVRTIMVRGGLGRLKLEFTVNRLHSRSENFFLWLIRLEGVISGGIDVVPKLLRPG